MSRRTFQSKGVWRQRCFSTALLVGFVTLLLHFYTFERSTFDRTWTNSSQSPVNLSAPDEDDLLYLVPYPNNYSLIIDEPLRCRQERPFLVLVVPVAPGDRMARDVIRRTWAPKTPVKGRLVHHYFMMGVTSEDNDTMCFLQKRLHKESLVYHDILQSDFVDSYRNLSIKTMVMFEWLHSHCPDSFYAMKVDSDVFLNLGNLVDALLLAPRLSFFTGFVQRFSLVVRDKSSKWYLPFSLLPDASYPPYALGLGYVFSADLPERILDASRRVRAVYIEDVYVGLCLRELNVAVSDPPGSAPFRSGLPFLVMPCYWTTVITTLLRDSEELLVTWKTFQRQLKDC